MMEMVSPADMRGTAIGALLEQTRQFLTERQVPAWVVGGLVRDMYLDLPTMDADLVVDSPNIESVGRQLADEMAARSTIWIKTATMSVSSPPRTRQGSARAWTLRHRRAATSPPTWRVVISPSMLWPCQWSRGTLWTP